MTVRKNQAKFRRRFSIAFAFAFVALLALPLLSFSFYGSSDRVSEKRKAVGFSSVSSGYKEFSKTFEKWFEDHFGLRSAMIRFYRQSRFEMGLLGSGSPVIRGTDDWLYLSGGGESDPIQSYSGAVAFSEGELDRLQLYFEEWGAWLEGNGIAFIVLIAPNKVSVYPEYLPDGIPKSPYGTRTERFLKRMSGTNVSIVYPIDELVESKSVDYQLYYKLDTHWNARGAFIACVELAQDLSIRFPVGDFQFDGKLRSGGDLSSILGVESDWDDIEYQVNLNKGEWAEGEGDWALAGNPKYRFRTDNAALPKALVVHDSFMEPMGSLLARHFSETIFWSEKPLNRDLILETQPDVVILEFTERVLHGYLKYALPDPEPIR